MVAYFFRFTGSMWYGIAFARNMDELYSQIDQHGDPSGCEIKKANNASVCWQVIPDDDCGPEEYERSEECLCLEDETGWRKSPWSEGVA